MAAMAAGLAAVLLLTHRQPVPAGPSLAEHDGAWIIGEKPAESGPLAPGSDLRGTGVAKLVLADGSQLTLSDGFVRLPDAATGALRLESGSLTVAAQTQDPAAPLRIETPHAEASVVGTRFHLHVSSAGTELQVEDGSVRFADRIRGTVALVKAGGKAAAVPGEPAMPDSGPWSPHLARGSAAMPWTPVPGDPTRLELAFAWQPDSRWAAIDQELPASIGSQLILTLQTIADDPGAEWSVNGHEADGDVWLLAFGPLAELDRDQPQRIAIRLDQQPQKLLFSGGDGNWSGQAPRVFSVGMAKASGRIRIGWPTLAP